MTKRRTRGAGGLTHRSDGRWQGSYDITVDGRTRRAYVYARTKRDARLKLDQAIRDRDAGLAVASTMTVKDWLADWLERKQRPPKPLKPNTVRGYQSKVDVHIVPALGKRRLTDLRPDDIERMYDGMRAKGLAEASVRQTHAILKKALSDAVRRGQLARSPMDRVDPPGTETNDREQFTPDQARQVLAAADDDARWWLALFYGMRQGECLGLRWEDVDTATWATLAVEQTLQTDKDGKLLFGAPKSKASRRVLPLIPVMAARLKAHWFTQGCPTSGLVFHLAGHPDRPLQPKADWRAWRDLVAAASTDDNPLPPIALHAARNTAASMLEAAGVPDRLVMQILGQSQVRTTHGYQTADLPRMAAAFEGVGNLLELN